MTKAVVVGSKGNVGKPLVTYLRRQGYEVFESDIKPAWHEGFLMADINHPVDLLPAFDWGPDVVYILGAMVSRVTCEQAASLAITSNLAGLNNLLQLCKRARAKVVFFSTSEVYGPHVALMDEALADPQPNNRYGLSKLLGEQLVRYEAQHHGLGATILRPFMIYDENEDFGDHRSAMIRFATHLAVGEPIEVHRESERGWLHASDAVRAIEAASRLDRCEVINIGHPDIRPIAELAEMVRRELGADTSLVRTREIPKQMTLRKRPTLEKMQTLLNVTPRVELEQGVKLVCDKVRERLRLDAAIA